MRSDMNRVLIERPRYNPVPSLKNPKGYYRELERLDKLELLPKKEFLRKRWNKRGDWEKKDFSDLLGPIKRFLRSKVGQKWDEVYKEINEQNVDSHFLRHINDYVEKHVQYKPSFFYVDPEGLLREVEKKSRKKTKPSIPWIDEKELRLLYKVDHVWYEIQLAVVPIPLYYYMEYYDVILKKNIRPYGQVKKYNLHFSNPLLYKHRDFYCKYKRQLSSKELKKYRKEGLIK